MMYSMTEPEWIFLACCASAPTGFLQINWQRLVARFFLSHMESEKRVKRLQVNRVVDTLTLQPGQKIADIGAGSGLFSFPLARKVETSGHVYAIDANPELVEHLAQRAEETCLDNVTAVLAPEDDPKIPEPVDLVFLCNTLHHVRNPLAYLDKVRGYLNSQGRIAVIDFKRKWSLFHSRKYSLEKLDEWMKSAGLELEQSHDFLEGDFFVIYRITG